MILSGFCRDPEYFPQRKAERLQPSEYYKQKAGADGAVLLKKTGPELKFPCSDISLKDYPKTKAYLDKMQLSPKDVIVISFSDSEPKAIDGALSIALDLATIKH